MLALTLALQIGGVFNNVLYRHPKTTLSRPHRADIPNPFAVTASLGLEFPFRHAGTALDVERGLYTTAYAYGMPEDGQVEITLYAHRGVRSLLVLEVSAHIATGFGTTVNVSLDRCGPGIDCSNLTDFVVATDRPGMSQ